MQLTLLDTDGPRHVELEFRHDPPELPAPVEADSQPLLAGMSIDLLSPDQKKQMQVQVNLLSGELHLIGQGQSFLVAESRTADELRLTLYSLLVKSWREDWEPESLLPAACSLLLQLESEISRISGLDPLEQAPGISSD